MVVIIMVILAVIKIQVQITTPSDNSAGNKTIEINSSDCSNNSNSTRTCGFRAGGHEYERIRHYLLRRDGSRHSPKGLRLKTPGTLNLAMKKSYLRLFPSHSAAEFHVLMLVTHVFCILNLEQQKGNL